MFLQDFISFALRSVRACVQGALGDLFFLDRGYGVYAAAFRRREPGALFSAGLPMASSELWRSWLMLHTNEFN